MGVAVAGPVAITAPADAAPGGSKGPKVGQGPAGDHGSQGRAKGHSQRDQKQDSQKQDSRKNSPGGGKPDGPSSQQASAQQGGGKSNAAPGHTSGNAGGGDSNAAATPPPRAGGQGARGSNSAPPKAGATSGAKGGKGGDPAGNNGTVKIETAGDADGTPNNVTHVGCTFQIEWYGFDEGDDIVSDVTFTSHAPTGDAVISGDSPSQVFVGGDPASGAGTDSGLDGVQEYRLSFDGEPHPKQGYHVKLTIHTPGSIGADTKHKVFWVQPCEEPPPGEEEPPPGGEEEQPPDDTDVESEQEREDTEVRGEQEVRERATAPSVVEQVPTAVDAGLSAGISMVSSPLALLVTLLGLLLAAAGYVVRRRGA